MQRYQPLGRGAEADKPDYPYDVAIYWPDPPLADPHPIALGEGTGWMSAGGSFKLADLLDEKWTRHLELCGCLYLRELARQEQREGRILSTDEIWEKWQDKGLEP